VEKICLGGRSPRRAPRGTTTCCGYLLGPDIRWTSTQVAASTGSLRGGGMQSGPASPITGYTERFAYSTASPALPGRYSEMHMRPLASQTGFLQYLSAVTSVTFVHPINQVVGGLSVRTCYGARAMRCLLASVAAEYASYVWSLCVLLRELYARNVTRMVCSHAGCCMTGRRTHRARTALFRRYYVVAQLSVLVVRSYTRVGTVFDPGECMPGTAVKVMSKTASVSLYVAQLTACFDYTLWCRSSSQGTAKYFALVPPALQAQSGSRRLLFVYKGAQPSWTLFFNLCGQGTADLQQSGGGHPIWGCEATCKMCTKYMRFWGMRPFMWVWGGPAAPRSKTQNSIPFVWSEGS